MSNGYGISNWEDAKTIYSELHELTSKPIYCVTEDALKDVLDYFETKCAKSKAITTEAVHPWRCPAQPRLQLSLPDLRNKG